MGLDRIYDNFDFTFTKAAVPLTLKGCFQSVRYSHSLGDSTCALNAYITLIFFLE